MSVEERLRTLEVEWPAAPDVTPRVRARLETAPRRRRWPRVAIPLAIVALVAAVPPARSTVLDWFGIGGETIERVPEQPTPSPAPLDLGERVPLPADALVPAELGEPDAVYRDAANILTLRYRGALLSQFPGQTREEYVRKMAGPGTRIERVTVDGEVGYWLAGAPHGVLYEDPSGTVREARARLAGNTLVWRHGELTLRLEADVTKERALAIARSVR